MTNKVKVASGIDLVAGLWLMLSAFLMSVGFMSNEFVIGILVALFAIIELSATESTAWLGWVNAVLGLWLLLTPLFFVGLAMGATWNSVILGIIVIASSLWGAMGSSTMGMGHPKMG